MGRNKEIMYAESADPDLFSRLGIPLADLDVTPLRLAELQASAARMRELTARQAGTPLTTFHLAIRDIDINSFTWDAWFDPPLRPESADPMGAAEKLGGMLLLILDKLVNDAQIVPEERSNTPPLAHPSGPRKRGRPPKVKAPC